MAQELTSINLVAPAFKGINTEDSPLAQDPSFAEVADNAVIADVLLPILVAIVADNAVITELTDVIAAVLFPILVAIVADSAVIADVLLPILVAIVADNATA